MTGILSNVIPIILLIFLGYVIRSKEMLRESTLEDIKKLVINISLPAILFMTFVNMKFKEEYFLIMVVTFVMLGVFYFGGCLVNKIKILEHPLNPFMTTTFCFGLLGVPLYGTVFGVENLDKISIFGVGHELFIWLIYYNVLKMKFKNEKISLKVIKDLFKSPLLLSVFLGIILNLLGVGIYLQQNPVLKGINSTIQYIANLGTPLILIIIGFDLKFNKKYMKQSTIFVVTRMFIILTLGYAFKYLIIDKLVNPEPLFNYAYFTFLILPIPFSLPIFVGEYCDEYKELVNNSVVLSTVLCIIIFIAFILLI
ncbi:AEC family transporter [Clostridium brassicae]|uniref:AEC family transporter n=1 Tax=Clostridium brassicae TaxID=2999072 RepID=A0ABT4D577_9CLOT|nr:AEC family transporter [Clostridium brassicae]MCY6957444.1 AEC family transporter [Clostridium brassicae]